MKTTNELYVSQSLKEVWEWKEKAYLATKDMSFEQLMEHYKKNAENAAKLLGTRITKTENGAYKFAKTHS